MRFKMLLYPFSILYKGITAFRNYLYTNNIKRAFLPPVATVIVGNLSTGGTGKTPHVAWLIEQFCDKYKIVTLSRGYKRKTKGFLVADKQTSNAHTIGDEPMEYVLRFPDVQVTVGEKRVLAAQKILARFPNTDLLILDDAYQHRAIDGHIKILLTTYDTPFYRDKVLPQGSLRESAVGYKRANFIIVTKCPKQLPIQEKQAIVAAINPQQHQHILFSHYEYDAPKRLLDNTVLSWDNRTIVLVSGIANAQPLIAYLETQHTVIPLSYKDHFEYTATNIQTILETYPVDNYQIVLTRKDAVKWLLFKEIWMHRTIAVVDVRVVFQNDTRLLTQQIEHIILQQYE
jgi:tetraacyldisaccharide 4'-kinase